MKIVKSLKELGILIKFVWEIIKIATKDQKGKFVDTLLGTLNASFLEIMSVGKSVIRVLRTSVRQVKKKLEHVINFYAISFFSYF